MDRQRGTVLSLACSERLDAVALRKLVLFVNGLMEQYFDFVRQRVQLEVSALWCVSLICVREVSSQVCCEMFLPARSPPAFKISCHCSAFLLFLQILWKSL